MRIAAVIIAGGKSERMGGIEKLFLSLRGKTILKRIVGIISPQVDQIAVNANGDPSRFAEHRLPVIEDIRRSVGTPLAGLHAALHWAQDNRFDRLLTVPSDTPFLPANLVSRLDLQNSGAAIAASLGQTHYLTGLWPPLLAETLDQAISSRTSVRVQDWAGSVSPAIIEWQPAGYDPFMNINMPVDLAEAERLAAEFGL